MNTPMLAYVVERLPKNLSELEPLAKKTGVPAKTMEKIARGHTKNPRIQTVQSLYDYFRSKRA